MNSRAFDCNLPGKFRIIIYLFNRIKRLPVMNLICNAQKTNFYGQITFIECILKPATVLRGKSLCRDVPNCMVEFLNREGKNEHNSLFTTRHITCQALKYIFSNAEHDVR